MFASVWPTEKKVTKSARPRQILALTCFLNSPAQLFKAAAREGCSGPRLSSKTAIRAFMPAYNGSASSYFPCRAVPRDGTTTVHPSHQYISQNAHFILQSSKENVSPHTCLVNNRARLMTDWTASGWSGPRAFRRMVRERVNSGSASRYLPWSAMKSANGTWSGEMGGETNTSTTLETPVATSFCRIECKRFTQSR